MNYLNVNNRKLFQSDKLPRKFLGSTITIGRAFSFKKLINLYLPPTATTKTLALFP